MPKVIAGMSGGIDSAVSACLLKEKGYEVEGISFLMWEAKKVPGPPACYSLQSMEEASKTARSIGIPHSTIDVRNDFIEKVVRPFVDAYVSGLTPNPCVLCNRFIKFPYLIKEAEKRGAGYISTGHYARIERSGDAVYRIQDMEKEKYVLKKGIDPKKDQSYVLYVLTQEQLRRLILPLGYRSKSDVRKMARELDLPAAQRPESQEICFIGEKNYLNFIVNLSPVRGEPGPIVDLSGRLIGKHKGIYGYTIGQRKGLGISSPEPLYVVDIDLRNNTVYTGPREAAKKKEFLVGELNWITPLISPLARGDKEGLQGSGEAEFSTFRASVRVRSTMNEQPATLYAATSKKYDNRASCIMHHASLESVRVVFDEPQWAPAPGQSAVFYEEDTVIGGGIIKKPV